jgi:hypothetical protein
VAIWAAVIASGSEAIQPKAAAAQPGLLRRFAPSQRRREHDVKTKGLSAPDFVNSAFVRMETFFFTLAVLSTMALRAIAESGAQLRVVDKTARVKHAPPCETKEEFRLDGTTEV